MLAFAAVCATARAAPQTLPGPPAGGAPPAEVSVPGAPGEGLRLALEQPDLELRLRGRVHVDLVSGDAPSLAAATGADLEGGREVRRARVLADGRLGDAWRARLQIDGAGSELDWKDAWLERRDLPLGPLGPVDVRAGHFREPFGLEALTSATHVAFVERSAATDAFTPGRSRGAQLSGALPAGRWQLGAFRAASGTPFPDELDTGRALTARATWRPIERAERTLQLGASASWRDPGADGARFSARPGARVLPRLVDTGALAAARVDLAGLEALWIDGGATLQAEAFGARVDLEGAGSVDLTGGHLQAAWFLTPGRTTLRARRAAPGAPDVPSAFAGGPGALEVAARWARVDLTDGTVTGGRQDVLSLGFNVYLAPGSRVMVDWNEVRVGDARGDFLAVRLQLEL